MFFLFLSPSHFEQPDDAFSQGNYCVVTASGRNGIVCFHFTMPQPNNGSDGFEFRFTSLLHGKLARVNDLKDTTNAIEYKSEVYMYFIHVR
jgi:hypothetical protein